MRKIGLVYAIVLAMVAPWSVRAQTASNTTNVAVRSGAIHHSLQLYAQPFLSSAEFGEPKEFKEPRTFTPTPRHPAHIWRSSHCAALYVLAI